MPSTLFRTTVFVILQLCASALVRAVESSDSPIAVGLQKQLLVDDHVIAERANVARVLGQVTKVNDGKPIFTQGRLYGTVLYDEGRFKLWWRKLGQEGYAYAESHDGVRFQTKADLTGIPFAGDYTLAVMIDPHETDPAHRYKAGYDAVGMAAGLAHSADGIHWKLYNDGKPVTGRAADTYNQILWDDMAKTYRLLTRTDFGTPGGPGEIRGTRMMTNPDVKADPTAWTTTSEWKLDDPPRRQIYNFADWIYEGIHFGLVPVYEYVADFSEGTATDRKKRHERDIMNFYIATSRNGDDWDVSWIESGQPMIPRGGDGAFDKDIVLPASQIVTHDDRHWLYYMGANERHGNDEVRFDREHAIGLATLPLDRFVGLRATETPGTITTKPFQLEGPILQVNADCKKGSVAVEVLDAQGKAIPEFTQADARPLQKRDELKAVPRWNNHADLSSLVGQTVRLRFHLNDATLYSFQIKQ